MEPFSAPVEEVCLVSRPHCSICSFRYFSVPSIAKAQRASWSCTKGCWRLIISVASFVWQKLVFFRCLNMLLLRIIWRTAALWREKNTNLRGGKIALLFRGLNMHILRITLEHSRYLNERKTINLQSGCKEFRDAYNQDPGLCAFPAQPFWRQSFGLPFDLCGILP